MTVMKDIDRDNNTTPSSSRLGKKGWKRGVTLVEMLVVIAVTLVMMAVLVQIFAVLGDGIHAGRAIIEQAGELRATATRLQRDLDGLTLQTLPWNELQGGGGYFEYLDGIGRDRSIGTNDDVNALLDTTLGDVDDVLMFTSHTIEDPFAGRIHGKLAIENGRLTVKRVGVEPNIQPQIIESNAAEIIWWTQLNDLDGDGLRDAGERVTLHRRVLLVRPDIDLSPYSVPTAVPPADFFNANDISARFDGTTSTWQANSLADLSKREFRFAHGVDVNDPTAFPFAINTVLLRGRTLINNPATSVFRQGEDVMLGKMVAFDARVFDPRAPLVMRSGVVLSPGDPGFNLNLSLTPVGFGAYVDLNYAGSNVLSDFSGPPQLKSGLSIPPIPPVYDTWPFHYEHDGLDQDSNFSNFGIDQGTNGLDDDGVNGVDDLGERETSPPYPVALRGLQVKIRVYEPDSQNVRQVTVTANFVPE